nr:hypothetical protein [Actinomycetota bacterium]
ALRRADEQLTTAFDQAPWITPNTRTDLHRRLQELESSAGAAASPAFGKGTEALATEVDRAFGITG